MGDSSEIRLLIGGGWISLDPEIPQYRPQHDIHFGDREISTDTPACSTAKRQPCWCRRSGSAEAVRIESFGARKDFGILVNIGNAHEHRAIIRNSPLAEGVVRRTDPAAKHIDHGAYSQRILNRRSTELVATLIDLYDQFGQHVWVAPQPLKRPGQC